MGLLKGLIKFIIGLITGKKPSAGDVLLDKSAYRNDEQDKAMHYFSDRNKKGCLASIKGCFKKKPKPATPKVKKKKGCFPKKLGFMSDKEYDNLVAGMLQKMDVKNKGLKKLGLDDSQVEKTIEFGAYRWYTDDGNIAEGVKLDCEDGLYRSTIYAKTFIFFTRSQVAIYKIVINTDWEKHEEDTYEYHYKDITSLTTSTNHEDYIDIFKGDTIFKCDKNEFVLIVPGDSFRVTLGNKPSAEEESAIQAMKAMIREKKA